MPEKKEQPDVTVGDIWAAGCWTLIVMTVFFLAVGFALGWYFGP